MQDVAPIAGLDVARQVGRDLIEQAYIVKQNIRLGFGRSEDVNLYPWETEQIPCDLAGQSVGLTETSPRDDQGLLPVKIGADEPLLSLVRFEAVTSNFAESQRIIDQQTVILYFRARN